MSKPFKETKVGSWLSKNAPKVLDATLAAGSLFYPPLDKIRDLLNGDPDLTPEQKADFQKMEMEFDLELMKAQFADVDSARKMQIAALTQDDRFSKRFIYYLSSFVLLSATAFGIMLFFVKVPEENQRLVDMYADVYLLAGAITILNFFFGNSHRRSKASDR